METKAHYVLIGAFTLLMIAAGFGLVLFFSGTGSISPRKTLEVIFNGSVAGLSRGASVTFNGLRIGEVTSMGFVANDPSRVAAFVQVDNDAPVRADAKARLETQGLTGSAVIALTGGSPDAPQLVGKNGAPPTLMGEPSQLQNVLGHVEDLSAKADALISKADKLISDNGDSLTDTVKNIDAFSKALGENASGLQGALAAIAELSRRAAPLADRLTKLTDDADHTLNALDSTKINGIVDDVSKFTGALSQSEGDVKSLLSDTAAFAKRINESSSALTSTVTNLDALVKTVDKQKIANFVDGADALGSALRDNRGNIDNLIKNASELSAKLNDSADKIDGVMTSVQSFLGSSDIKGPFAQIGDAAKSVRQLADDVDHSTRELTVGLVRFSNTGLKEYEALAVDGRRTVNDLDRLLRSLESNPSQLLFGAKGDGQLKH